MDLQNLWFGKGDPGHQFMTIFGQVSGCTPLKTETSKSSKKGSHILKGYQSYTTKSCVVLGLMMPSKVMTFDGNPYLASSRHGNGRGSFLIMLGHFDSNFSRPTTRNSWVGKGHLSKLYHRKHGVLHWKLLQLGWFFWAMSAIDKREVLWLLSDLWSLPRRWSAPSATSWRVSVRSRSNRGHTPGQ